MAQILIAEPGLGDGSILSSSATIATSMPLSNLQTMQPTDKTRFIDLTQTISITIDASAIFGAGLLYTQWNAIYLPFNNTTSAGVISLASSSSLAGLAGAAITTYPTWPAPGLKPYFPRVHSRIYLPTPSTDPYIMITIADSANPDGFIDIGRLYIADGYVPQYPMAFGEMPNPTELERVIRAEGGPTYARQSGIDENFNPVLQTYSDAGKAEFYNRIQRIKRLRGTSRDILIDYDVLDNTYAMDGIQYGRLTNVQAPKQTAFQLYEIPLSLAGLR